LELSDGITLKSALVARQPGTEEVLRISDDSGRAISTDLDSHRYVTLSLRANKRRNEDGDLEVCTILVQRLNRDGANWHDLVHLKPKSNQEAGVDCRAKNGSRVLNIQVTRACPDQTLWSHVDPQVPVKRSESVSRYAEELHDAIVKKKTQPKAGIVLALDSIETPHVVKAVVELFRNKYAGWVRSLGYEAIWLVGPSPDITFCLDQED
jgi:hypothetical protein